MAYEMEETQIPSLHDWAWFGVFREAVNTLSELALPERWSYKNVDPNYPNPILAAYIKYTFYRLMKERKVLCNGQYAAFNTGLVNRFYDPIYALFDKNRNEGKQEWHFLNFCTAGEGRAGKTLTNNFSLPERASYFSDPAELIYDLRAPRPQLDWRRIVLDNINRIPTAFWERYTPKDFTLRDVNTLSDKDVYFAKLAFALENDEQTFRAVKSRFTESLELALKRVAWDFRTAVPIYNLKRDGLSLLFPLSLLNDTEIDLALVIERQERSGLYIGHMILPLAWAYTDARLIMRPDSDWLQVEQIASLGFPSDELV